MEEINKVLAVATLLIIVGSIGLSYSVTKTLFIPSSVNVRTIGVEAYWYANHTNPVTQIDWGWFYPGNTSTQTFYLYNPGNTPIKVYLTTQNWSPAAAEGYLTCSWDQEANTIEAGLTVETTFTVYVNTTIAETTISSVVWEYVITGYGT